MTPEFLQWLSSDNGLGTHISLFIMLLLGGFGFPIPEDIPLVLGGVAASTNLVSLKGIFLTCYVGVVLADQIIFLFGYCFGKKLLHAGTKSTFFPSITEDRIDTIRVGLRKRRFWYILLGRHFFPVRTATFLIAGALRIPYIEFLVADAFAALISVGIVVWLGYLLGAQLTPEMISHIVKQSNYYILAIVLLSALLFFAGKKRRAQKKEARAKQEQELAPLGANE